jgi:hypothetical protein
MAKVGRKRISDNVMKPRSVRLDDETVALAMSIGEGNLSAGLRMAVHKTVDAKELENQREKGGATSVKQIAPTIAQAAQDPSAFLHRLGRITQ